MTLRLMQAAALLVLAACGAPTDADGPHVVSAELSTPAPLVRTLRVLAGCAAAPSPLNTTAWRDPDYKGPPFKKIFVVGLSAQSLTDQRGFENLMVSTLQGAGVVAVRQCNATHRGAARAGGRHRRRTRGRRATRGRS